MNIAREDAKAKPKKTLDEQLPLWLSDFKDVLELQSFIAVCTCLAGSQITTNRRKIGLVFVTAIS